MLSFLNNFLLIIDFCKPLKEILFCSSKSSVSTMQDSLNDCTDRLFIVIDGLLADYVEPLELPEFHTGFNTTFFLTYYGDIDLYEGFLENLSTLKRGGNISYHSNKRKMTVTLPLRFQYLTFVYNYNATIMGVGPSGKIYGNVNNIELEVTIAFNYIDSAVTLEEFRVADAGYLNLEFDGHLFIDWIFNLLGDILITVLRKQILIDVEEIVKNESQAVFRKINKVIEEFTQFAFLSVFLERLQLSVTTSEDDVF